MEDKNESNEKRILPLQIYDLPIEILEKIFQYLELPERLRADEAFSGHTNVQSCLWRIFKLEVERCSLYDACEHFFRSLPFTDLLKILHKSRKNLRKLSFDLNLCPSEHLSVVSNGATHFITSGWDPETFLQCAIGHCNNLRLLKLHLARPIQMKFCKLIRVNEKLESILFHVEDITEHEYLQLSEALKSFPKLNKNLSVYRSEKREVVDCPEMLYETFNLQEYESCARFDKTRSLFQKLVQRNLKNLQLGNFWSPKELWTFQEMKVVAQFTNLIELHLRGMDCFVTDEVMIAILKGCTKLKTIRLESIDNVTAKCMNTIMTSSTSMKTVELENIHIHSLLLDGVKSKVESLHLFACPFDSWKEVEKISNFPNLKKLFLSIHKRDYHTMHIDEVNLLPISKNCRKLEEVTLFNDKDNEISINGIASFADLPNLRSYHVEFCNMTTIYPEKIIPSVVELQSACCERNDLGSHFCSPKLPISNLRSLYISQCNKLSKFSLVQAVSHMPYLEIFHITDENESMTNEVIENIVTFCRKLRTLELNGCIEVTASGIIALKDCQSLVNLSLCCLEIQEFPLSDLVKPNLKMLQLLDLPHISKDFVMNSLTEEMKSSMFMLEYDGDELI